MSGVMLSKPQGFPVGSHLLGEFSNFRNYYLQHSITSVTTAFSSSSESVLKEGDNFMSPQGHSQFLNLGEGFTIFFSIPHDYLKLFLDVHLFLNYRLITFHVYRRRHNAV